MIDPLKRMTAELQKIKQERRFIQGQVTGSRTSRQHYSPNIEVTTGSRLRLWRQNLGGGTSHLKTREMEKEFAAKEEALCQILQMKEVGSAKMYGWINRR
jgi:hypothetical protein